MTPKQIHKAIQEWETKAQECFYDYFVDNRVTVTSWACYLLGKGFKAHAKFLFEKGEELDLDEKFGLFHVRDEENEFIQGNYNRNLREMSEFISNIPPLLKEFKKFINEIN